ncbi:hypothetical protein ARMGADRAFT_1040746 [Armillaria gallica]|uniref:Uncharacterized protein n=1 Tax=Armillaria gallica TaxID=47427 RepID=A0A2H3CW56_ARMGA|nr:hypothetical protein ARMGADRAFT_1040746 [Armillaria gallica]
MSVMVNYSHPANIPRHSAILSPNIVPFCACASNPQASGLMLKSLATSTMTYCRLAKHLVQVGGRIERDRINEGDGEKDAPSPKPLLSPLPLPTFVPRKHTILRSNNVLLNMRKRSRWGGFAPTSCMNIGYYYQRGNSIYDVDLMGRVRRATSPCPNSTPFSSPLLGTKQGQPEIRWKEAFRSMSDGPNSRGYQHQIPPATEMAHETVFI